MSFSDLNAPLTRRYDLLRLGVDGTGRDHDVLRLQRRRQRGGGETVAGQLGGRELNIDALGLGADQVHLGDIRHLQQPRADILDIVAQLAIGESVRGKAIDDAVGVAELVVGDRADHPRRQRQLDVLHLLANLVPGVRHLLRPGRSLQIHEDRRLARPGVALQVVEVRRFLQLALDPLGDLKQRIVQRRARPLRLHHHRLDGEGGVLVAPQSQVGGDAEDNERRHQEVYNGTVRDRPGGQVEAVIAQSPSRRTFWPGRKACTPAVTTTSPSLSPPLRQCRQSPGVAAGRVAATPAGSAGSTTQTAGLLSTLVSAVAGSSMPPGATMCACPVTVAPSRMASGRSVSPTLTR